MSVQDTTTAGSRLHHRTPESCVAGPTVARLLVQGFVRGLKPCGVDARRVLRCCDLDEASLEALPERVPYALMRRLFLVAASEVSGEVGLGLRLAESVRIETWETLGYVLRSSGTLGDALVRAARYVRLLSDAAALSLHVGGQRALLLYRNPYPALALPDITEFVLGVIAALGRQLSGHHLVPLEVRFAHAPPADTTRHARLFDAPVRFAAPHDGLVFDAALLHYEIGSRDPRLCTLLEQQADRAIRTLPEPRRIAFAVEEQIAASMADGETSADRIAARLKLHPKALARRLHTEGTSFRRLLEAVRREAAERYLTVSDHSVGEVAFLLGYADQSAFHKAFRRWTGAAPAHYRRRAQTLVLGS